MFSNLRRTILIIGSTKETLEVEKKIIDKSVFLDMSTLLKIIQKRLQP